MISSATRHAPVQPAMEFFPSHTTLFGGAAVGHGCMSVARYFMRVTAVCSQTYVPDVAGKVQAGGGVSDDLPQSCRFDLLERLCHLLMCMSVSLLDMRCQGYK